MRQSDISKVRSLDLFRDMSDESFEILIHGAFLMSFPAGSDLITEGENSDFLHILIEGSVELFAGWSGHETVMVTLQPVATFILAATIRDAPYLMSARTVSKSSVVLLPSSNVRDVLKQDGTFSNVLLQEMAQCYRAVIKNTKNLKLRSSVERLANYLLRCHRRAGDTPEFDLLVEKKKLASIMGMTPENLSRAIKALRAHGVEITGSKVHLTDVAALERFADPTPLIDQADY